MLHLTTISNEDVMLQVSDILLIKSCGSAKTIIQLRGVSEQLTIDASFDQIKSAINNEQSHLTDVLSPLKIVTRNKI
ncbi:hypothetical protein [uncultured Cedecea sp.]|uniref:hypothetical protein n=1 Tax=uncultured Cedecea sp. TaxID=988762 RepID=UPI002632B8B3|nr:hypothetical protein [uncultured Cedecea sp.]